jgi:hypothetical protein
MSSSLLPENIDPAITSIQPSPTDRGVSIVNSADWRISESADEMGAP